ncbi:trigger factor [Nonlabens spongiae]|uniref:Trigger factor n=1 Tax=Nonlabens spongiae TaxID=331648 RepID=A0A1W6MKV1_9FLAO|nr:trigger factor [Nonlabens spongiae]ARN78099.1 trigger factor [Nonlabens spongiae]
MNINRTDVDALNAVLSLEIKQEDYKEKVEKILKDYRKTANVPGFRKGHVPAGLINKKYRVPVMVDEINKMIQEKLNSYIQEEKLELLGNPLPKEQEDIDWENAKDFNFEFEIGLAPEFDVDLKGKKITSYEIKVDDKTINDQIDRIREQYGKLVNKDEVAEGDEITGVFRNDDEDINVDATFKTDRIKGKTNMKKLVGSKPGDVLKLKTQNLFENDQDLNNLLKIDQEKVDEGINVPLEFEITEVNTREKAEMTQEFFDKLFGPDAIKSEDELKERLREDASKQFAQQTDQKLLTDVTESLIENTKFDLPADFLKRWIANNGEQEMTAEEAEEEYNRSEKGLRYQLIEGNLIKNNEDLQLKFEDLQEYARTMIRQQMAQYGHTGATDEEVDQVVARIMSNQDEVKKMSEQLQNEKMLDFFKENVSLKKKEVSYEKFIEEAYGA